MPGTGNRVGGLKNIMMIRVLALLAAGLLVATAVTAAGSAVPAPVRNHRLVVAWTAPDARPAAFDRVMLAPIELDFRAVAPMVGPTGASTSRTEFPVPERSRARIAANFDEVLREELARSGQFTLADQPGPGVLLLKPFLRDVVSRVPPEEPPGSGQTYVDEVGDATLVIEFIDASTGVLLGTATDRRTAAPAGSAGTFGALWANPVSTQFEVRRLARRWGVSLTKRVEQIQRETRPR